MADYQKIHNGSRIDADTFKDILNHIRLRVTEDYEFPPAVPAHSHRLQFLPLKCPIAMGLSVL